MLDHTIFWSWEKKNMAFAQNRLFFRDHQAETREMPNFTSMSLTFDRRDTPPQKKIHQLFCFLALLIHKQQ